MCRFRLLKLPPLKIHCWGGLGSQLFAIALYKRISRILRRRIILVFHTNGVTYRSFDKGLQEHLPKLKVVDDFAEERSQLNIYGDPAGGEAKLQRIAKAILKKILGMSGILSEINSEKSLASIKPWCLQIRGHYSYLDIPSDILESLWLMILQLDSRQTQNIPNSTIHWRLGDLVFLEEKKPVEFSRIKHTMSLVSESSNWNLYSDSSSTYIKNRFPEITKNLQVVDMPIKETIVDLVRSKHFIGTNSKISFWVACFRQLVPTALETFLPIESQKDFKRRLEHVNYYS